MSMSIPIFFQSVRMHNPKTNHVHVVVDGGMLSNYPVWLFDCEPGETPRWPTFGLLLVEPDPKTPITARLGTRRGRTLPRETWNREGYLSEFRTGEEHHRREEVSAEMRQAAVA